MIIPERLMVGIRNETASSFNLIKVTGSREPGICTPWWCSSQLGEQSGNFIINSKEPVNKESGNRNEKGPDSSRCQPISSPCSLALIPSAGCFWQGAGQGAGCYWLILSLQPFASSLHQSESSICMQINNQVHLDSVPHLHMSRTKLAYSPKYKRTLGPAFYLATHFCLPSHPTPAALFLNKTSSSCPHTFLSTLRRQTQLDPGNLQR